MRGNVSIMNLTPFDVNVTELMNTYAPSLHRYAARFVRDADAARDVVQDVFIRLSRLGPEQRPAAAAAKAWLYRVTHNQAVDHIRREQRRKKLHQTHAELTSVNRPPPQAHKLEAVLRNLHHLDEKQRSVLLLRLQEGLSYREISEVTGYTEGNVGYLLHHAVTAMAELVRREEAV